MARERGRFTPELKDEAVRLVIESGRPIAQAARELQVHDGTLGNWVQKVPRRAPGGGDGVEPVGSGAAAGLERENRQLRLDNEFLGKAAFFARECW